jgi:translocation and assembly module TamB
MARVAKILVLTIGAILVVAFIAIATLTSTDWGHEFVRKRAVAALGGFAHGIVRIGSVSGNLLSGITVRDLSIRDSSGAPFIAVERASVSYGIGSLLNKRLALRDVRLTGATVVLDKPPGGEWNWKRIFPSDTAASTDSTPGWGDWIALRDVILENAHVVVRIPWEPDSGLTPAARDSAIADALGGGTRAQVVRAPGGFQQVSEFRDIDARLPLLRLADPAYEARRAEVTRLSMIAAPFRPPVAEVRDLAGVFEFDDDSLWFRGTRAALPGSRVGGEGEYHFEDGDIVLRLVGAPVALADLRWVYPRLPSEGGGKLEFVMDGRGEGSRYIVRNADITTGGAHLAGDFGITLRDTMALHDTDLRFQRFDTRLVEQLVPGLEMPRRGTLSGRAALAGGVHAMRVNADVTFNDLQYGASRVAAVGEVGAVDAPEGGLRAANLRLTLQPVQVALARIVMPDLPIAGTVAGTATLDGSTQTRLVSRASLVHREDGERSQLAGRGEVRLAGGSTWLNVDVQARPISLVTVGRFAPATGLRGTAAGPIRLTGTLGDLALRSDLVLSPGGAVLTEGRFDFTGTPGYDVRTALRVFDLNAVMARAPHTGITARAQARGRGFDPATMRATFTADVASSTFDSLGIDSAHVRAAIADGLLQVQRGSLRGPAGFVEVGGSLGLTRARQGTLSYRVQLDSLGAVRGWIPVDTGVTAPRPGVVARALERARTDSAALARATEVERAVTGIAGPRLVVDTPRTVRNDSVGGSLFAAGTMRGNLSRFDLRGRLAARDLLLRGNSVHRAEAEFGVSRADTMPIAMILAARLDSVSAAGFQFDSAQARLSHRNPGGTASLAVYQEDNQYSASARYALHLSHKEVHFDDLALRFDTTSWVATRPGTVRWGGSGVELVTIELRSGETGRIYADGRIPSEGRADLRLEMANFEVGHLTDLLQTDVTARGLLSVAVDVEGTLADPRFRGAAGFVNAEYGGTKIPDLHATFDYAAAQLRARALAARSGGAPLATAEGILPINLAISGVTGSRLPDRPLSLDIIADSLPLDVLPQFTDAIENVRGRAIGAVKLRGTLRRPDMAGAVAVDLGSFGIAPLGVGVRNIVGTLRFMGDTVVIDSIAGWSGGRVWLAGGLGVEDWTQPSFDLKLVATNARVLNNDLGRLRADATIAVTGPFTAVEVKGGAVIREGVLYVPESDDKELIGAGDPTLFSVMDTSVVHDAELFPAQSPLLANLVMDVNLRINRDVWVRTPDANVEVYTPEDADLSIHVNRRIDAVVMNGFVATDRGTYEFMGKRFQITRGSATFIGSQELDPTLQITGEIPVQVAGRPAMNIRIIIGGTMSSPRLVLESDAQPPIPQTDLLSYLAFGRGASSLFQFGTTNSTTGSNAAGELAGTAGALAVRQMAGIALGVAADELEGEATRALGADVFDISPADVPDFFSSSPSLGNFLSGTQVEAGLYTDSRTFLGVTTAGNLDLPTLGLRVQRRIGEGLRVETSVGPRYLAREPSLGEQGPVSPRTSFGMYLIREWRF